MSLRRSAVSGVRWTGDAVFTPAWLANKSIREWIALQSPSAADIVPDPLPPGNSGVSSITDAWGGATLRENGSHLILNGGGHGDYAGNEIDAMRLSADVPTYQRIWGPTANADIITASKRYLDGNPAPMHTYTNLQYDQVRDRLMKMATSWYSTPTGNDRGVDSWNWMAANWNPEDTHPAQPSGSTFYIEQGISTAPNGDIYQFNSINRWRWNWASNDWTNRGDGAYWMGSTQAYDSLRHVIWNFGHDGGKAIKYVVGSNTETLETLTGDATDLDGYAKDGAVYIPEIDRVLIYIRTAAVYEFNPATLDVALLTTSGAGPSATADTTAKRPWNKFQRVPELRGVVIVPEWSQPTFFMRTH